jgi:ketosteroid isomerase-like protein
MWLKTFPAAILTVAIFSSQVSAQEEPAKNNKHESRTVASVRAVLDAQVAAWNRGDIEGYMAGYWRSEKTVFVSGNNITRGWHTVLEHYQKSYDSREKMGTLTFSDLEITLIGDGSAVALGRWHLQRAKDEPHGTFSLILRRTKQGWKIIHDHTSSAS